METGQIPGASSLSHWTVLEGDKEPVDIRPFELYLVLQVRAEVIPRETINLHGVGVTGTRMVAEVE